MNIGMIKSEDVLNLTIPGKKVLVKPFVLNRRVPYGMTAKYFSTCPVNYGYLASYWARRSAAASEPKYTPFAYPHMSDQLLRMARNIDPDHLLVMIDKQYQIEDIHQDGVEALEIPVDKLVLADWDYDRVSWQLFDLSRKQGERYRLKNLPVCVESHELRISACGSLDIERWDRCIDLSNQVAKIAVMCGSYTLPTIHTADGMVHIESVTPMASHGKAVMIHLHLFKSISSIRLESFDCPLRISVFGANYALFLIGRASDSYEDVIVTLSKRSWSSDLVVLDNCNGVTIIEPHTFVDDIPNLVIGTNSSFELVGMDKAVTVNSA
ncbi:MAG: hypothetical protein KatS3mg054_0030 [Chloroflexus sp.]|nr:MAG: hypothetical protein KatS3mg054_0030 [Chloroflexus sp.]